MRAGVCVLCESVCECIMCEYILFHITEAVVGFNKTSLRVEEEAAEVEVCVKVYSPSSDCPVNFSFTVRLNTRDGTAGEQSHLSSQHRLCPSFTQRVLMITELCHNW